jgi:tyrosinase
LPPTALVPVRAAIVASARPGAAMMLGQAPGITLGFKSVSVVVPIPPPQRTKFRALGATAAPVELELDGVELTDAGKHGGYSYDVYVNLPPTGGKSHPAAYFVGTVNSYSISVQQVNGAGPGPLTLSFPLSDALQAQARQGRLKSDSLTVSFVRAGRPKDAAEDAQFVKIMRIRVVVGGKNGGARG